jgi:excisionase family DNA binding protein
MVAMTQEREFLTVKEIADRMRVTEFTVRNWLRSGRLKGYRPGGTKAGWRVRESDLDRFIEASTPE